MNVLDVKRQELTTAAHEVESRILAEISGIILADFAAQIASQALDLSLAPSATSTRRLSCTFKNSYVRNSQWH